MPKSPKSFLLSPGPNAESPRWAHSNCCFPPWQRRRRQRSGDSHLALAVFHFGRQIGCLGLGKHCRSRNDATGRDPEPATRYGQYKFPQTPRMRMGEVDGIKGLKLSESPRGRKTVTCLYLAGPRRVAGKAYPPVVGSCTRDFPRAPADAEAARAVAARVARDDPTLPSDDQPGCPFRHPPTTSRVARPRSATSHCGPAMPAMGPSRPPAFPSANSAMPHVLEER